MHPLEALTKWTTGVLEALMQWTTGVLDSSTHKRSSHQAQDRRQRDERSSHQVQDRRQRDYSLQNRRMRVLKRPNHTLRN